MHMAEVTVVIPNYNGIGYLKDCLDTLREQTCKIMRQSLWIMVRRTEALRL